MFQFSFLLKKNDAPLSNKSCWFLSIWNFSSCDVNFHYWKLIYKLIRIVVLVHENRTREFIFYNKLGVF